jgi:2-polyprenyl-6-methoxyphenol hydroxylase-like FAD-dependent oxidoreductase
MHEAVVVGSGVAGLAAAISLGRAGGGPVLVIDRHVSLPPVHKGEFLQPGTLEVLRSWGVADDLGALGALRIEALECRDARGRRLGAFDYSALPHRYNFGLAHYYSEIRDALLKRAQQVADVRFGVRATGVIKGTAGRVTGVVADADGVAERLPARLVVAADGAGSVVRRSVGLDYQRYRYPHGFLGFDLAARGLPPRIVNFLTPQGARILYPLPGGRARLYVQVPVGQVAIARGRDAAAWRRELLDSCPGLGELLDPWPELGVPQAFSSFRGTAATWTVPGLVLIGEAAHSVHPMAGQGMNAAIIDGWSLGMAVQGDLDTAPARYADGRFAQVHRVSHLSNRLARLCTASTPWEHRLVRALLRYNRANRRIQLEATMRIAGLTDERLGPRLLLSLLTPSPAAHGLRTTGR